MAHITSALRDEPELSRVGVDIRLKIFWLHFPFPEKAQERYSALLTQLEEETGWRVYLHPHAQRKALLAAAQHLLPTNTNMVGKKTVYEETCTLLLTLNSLPEEGVCQEIAKRFAEETGWSLQLEQAIGEEVTDK